MFAMRYHVFDNRDGTKPVFTAPWHWLAYSLANLLSRRWEWCRLVDATTGQTLMEWARAREFVLGAGNATYSFVKIDKDGSRHEFLVGVTSYGKGQEPAGGHQPMSPLPRCNNIRLTGRD